MGAILEVKNLQYIYSAGTPFEHKALDNVSFSVERGEFIGIIGHTGNLQYIYSAGTPFEHKALDNVSFSVERGEFIGIIGHTGSGKSTLMQQLNGLLKPTAGTVLLDGKDIWSDKAFTRQARFRVGLVFQYPEYQLFEETVYRDIAFGPKNMGLDAQEVDRRVREAAGFVGLTEQQLEVSPFDLSGGQKHCLRAEKYGPGCAGGGPPGAGGRRFCGPDGAAAGGISV